MDNSNNNINKPINDSSATVMPSKPSNVSPSVMPSTNQNVQPELINKPTNETFKLHSVNPVINQNSPSSFQEVAPNLEAQEVDTSKKSSSNNIFFILVVALVVIIFFVDKLFEFLTDDKYNLENITVVEESSSNLYNGYFKIGDKGHFKNVLGVKIYNVIYSANNSVLMNFISYKGISNPKDLNIYIEVYDTNLSLIDRKLFEPKVIEANAVTEYSIYLDPKVFSKAIYLKVVDYKKEDINKVTQITCTKKEKDNYEYTQKRIYSFTFDYLKSYSIDYSLSYNENEEGYKISSIQNELKAESDKLNKYEIKNEYDKNFLKYEIDLSNVNKEFDSLYELDTLSSLVTTNETNEGWECK